MRIPAGICCLIFLCTLVISPGLALSARITVDGSQTLQTIEGLGVNVQSRSWNDNGEMQPVLDALLDAGFTQFRIVLDNADWESSNDDGDPATINWSFYSPIYSGAAFQKMWGVMRYLNQKGITNGVIVNFQGPGPGWMGGPVLTAGYEQEWAEMIASALIYARYTNGLQFSLIEPDNEPDLRNCGILMPVEQYLAAYRALALKLETNGMGDIRFIAPDLAFGDTNFFNSLMQDSFLMSKVAHFGVHGYTPVTRGSDGLKDFLSSSPYPDSTFWMTEFNVWCSSCQFGTSGEDTWKYARGTAAYLLHNLYNGASAAWVWEACDSQCAACGPQLFWSLWGLFSLDNPNDLTKTYTPRKTFFSLAQFTKFIRPGATVIPISGAAPLALMAFFDPATSQLTIAGVNNDTNTVALDCTVTNVPALQSLNFFYTDANNDLRQGMPVQINGGSFATTIPAESVFTLTGPVVPSPSVTFQTNGSGQVLSDINSPVLNLQSHTVIAVPTPGLVFVGWTGSITSSSPRLSITLTQDFSLEASFVPGAFTPARGSYYGLVQPLDSAMEKSSAFLTLRVTLKGNFTGKLRLGPKQYPLTGSFDSSGHTSVKIPRTKQSAINLELQADTTSDSDSITGILTDEAMTSAISLAHAISNSSRATNYSGQYTIIVTGRPLSTNAPGGDSYGTVLVQKAGSARIVLSLADGSKMSQAVHLTESGDLPLYLSLNSGKSSLSGWVTFSGRDQDDLHGVLQWTRPAIPRAKFYPSGFSFQTVLSGSRYQRADPNLTFTKSELVLQGQNIGATLTNRFSLTSDGVVSSDGSKPKLAFSPRTGTFSGAADSRIGKLRFKAVVLKREDRARGWFPGLGQSGQVLLQKSP